MKYLYNGNARRQSTSSDPGSTECLQSFLENKFDCLTLDLQRCQSDTVKLLLQLQDQMTSLESQVQLKVGRCPESARSARCASNAGVRTTPREPMPELPSTFPQTRYLSREAEIVPLLAEEVCDGSAGLPQTGDRIPSKASRIASKDTLPQGVKAHLRASMTFQEKLKIAQDSMQEGKVKQSWLVKNVTAFLEDPESSSAAWYYSQFMLAFLIFAVFVGLLPYVDMKLPISFDEELDSAIDSLLFLETIVRMLFCPNFKGFLWNMDNMIDSLSGIPPTVVLFMAGGACDREWGEPFLVAAVPVIRLLRMVRRFPKMQILISAFQNCLEALPVLLYTMAIMACIFTSLLFLVEPRDNIATLSESAWFVLTTISTVGYGDIVPCTQLGSAFSSILMVVSPLYMAMPFGIIGYNFTVIWGNRSQILLLNGTRDRLAKWGFGAYEIPRLFELFDLDESAEIDLQEFLLLLKEMEIGFREDDVIELFKVIDKDSGGTIDEREFVKTLYPTEYRYIFGRKKVKDFTFEEEAHERSAEECH